MAATNFPAGLYEGAELDSEGGFPGKEQKMAFLDKLIDVVGIHLHTHVSARSGKIVAGAEPERTNELLQLLAVAANSGVPSDAAVRRVLAGDHQPGPEGETSGSAAAPLPAPTAAPAPAPSPPAPAPSPPVAAPTLVSPPPAVVTTSVAAVGGGSGGGGPVRPTAGAVIPTAPAPSPPSSTEAGGAGGPAGGVAFPPTDAGAGGGSAAPRMMRPKTAQRRPPKIQENTAAVVAGGAPAGAPAAPVYGLIVEGGGGGDSDEEGKTDGAGRGGGGDGAGDLGGEGGRKAFSSLMRGDAAGKHTRDILGDAATGGGSGSGAGAGGSDADAGGGIRMGNIKRANSGGGLTGDAGRPAGGAYTPAELSALRDAIQKLCGSTLPLGKSLDFLSEDVEDMRSELRTWRAEFKKRGSWHACRGATGGGGAPGWVGCACGRSIAIYCRHSHPRCSRCRRRRVCSRGEGDGGLADFTAAGAGGRGGAHQ